MAWRYHGQYSPDPYAGRAHGSCDRCTRQWLLSQLQYQYDFRGDNLANTRFRVCPECMDIPYQGYRPVKLPPDPRPVLDPRVEPFAVEENAVGPFIPPGSQPPVGYTTEDGSAFYTTENGATIYVPE